MLSKPSHEDLEHVRPPTFHQSDQTSCSERTICGLESSKTNFGPQYNGHSGLRGAAYTCNSNEHVTEREMTSRSSILVNSRKRRIERTPIAVQALPCFPNSLPLGKRTKSSMGWPGLAGDMSYHKKNSGCCPKLDSANYLDSFCSNVSQPGSRISETDPRSISFDDLCRVDDDVSVTDSHFLINVHNDKDKVKSFKDINLNSMPSDCSSDVIVSQSIQKARGVKKHENSVEGHPWLRTEPVYNKEADDGHEESNQVESAIRQAYPACTDDVEQDKSEASDPSFKRIVECPDNNKPQIFHDYCLSDSLSFKALESTFEDVQSKEKDVVLDLNKALNSFCESEIELTADDHATANELNGKLVCFGDHIDLNSSINENEFSHCHATEIDLDGPVSPENKECSPPRGESDENQVETPFLCSGQEDADVQDEQVRIAAESIISISTPGFQTCQGKTICKLSEASNSSLDLFAGIVSSIVCHPENELRLILDGMDDEHLEEFLPDGMDYFEAMTLKLTETKVEECWYRSSTPQEEEIGTSAPLNQPRKGRTRRGRQRKDFQNEILPSLASLSRHEVTEDLQTIGGLIEAAGTCLGTGSLRYVARNGCARGRRRSGASTSNAKDGMVGSLQKQLSSMTKVSNEERSLLSWGKVTRRRRGQRYPISNPQLILSRV